MRYVTRVLTDIEQGNAKASEELLPLVYNELLRMASPENVLSSGTRVAP